jgi:hypothetical protein
MGNIAANTNKPKKCPECKKCEKCPDPSSTSCPPCESCPTTTAGKCDPCPTCPKCKLAEYTPNTVFSTSGNWAKTESRNWGDGSSNLVLSKIPIDCQGRGINSFRLVQGANTNEIQYEFKCTDNEIAPGAGSLDMTTPLNGVGDSVIFFDRHQLACPSNHIMSAMKLEVQSNDSMRWKYACIPAWDRSQICRSVTTPLTPAGKVNALFSQTVACNSDEALSAVQLVRDGGNIMYKYTCCKTTPTSCNATDPPAPSTLKPLPDIVSKVTDQPNNGCRSDLNQGICNPTMTSFSGNSRITNQTDSNLVVYQDNKSIWQSNTKKDGSNDNKLIMQSDGNLVLYTPDSKSVVWASNTNGKGSGPYTALMQDDGNFVIYDSNFKPTWSTKGGLVA